MVDMEILNDAELLQNIRFRYKLNLICTYVGPTLLVVNPFQPVPTLFNPEIKKQYIEQIIRGC
jgi:myosin-5